MLARGLVALALLASLRSSSAQSSTPACYYIRVSTPISNLGYSATLTSLGNCATSTVNVSRLYQEGACVSTRENNFQSRPDCGSSGGAVLAPVDQKTCRQVFSQGPASAFVSGKSISTGTKFDSGTVCNKVSQYGYFFVTTNCSTFPAATNAPLSSFFAYSSYPSDGCASVFPEYNYGSGHSVSRVVTAIIVIVVCIVFGLCVFGTLAALRRKKMQQVQQVQMQQFPPQGPYQQQPYGGGGGGGGYGQHQPYGAQPYGAPYGQPYQATQPYGKPVTGVPVGGGPSGSSWHTDTSPGTYPNPNAPSSGQGRPPAV